MDIYNQVERDYQNAQTEVERGGVEAPVYSP